MSLRHHLLVPIDFSANALEVVRATRQLALDHSMVTLLHVYQTNHVPPSASVSFVSAPMQLHGRQTGRLLESLREIRSTELRGVGCVNLEVLASPSPALAICRHAEEQSVDLIVMGTGARTAFSRLIIGSVAEHVVRAAPCPVLVVRPRRWRQASKYGRRGTWREVGMLECDM